MTKKRLLFITGTRADFGKLKPLIRAVDESTNFDYQIFGTGMHTMARYGNTILEIQRSGFNNLFTFINQTEGEDMEVILANTIIGLSRYLNENKFDLIVVHGDRVEALAGATVGALRNIRVAHVEGGEISGTVDELMRHAISKLSHLHFVATDVAKSRLEQLGEKPETVIKIGSPDADILLSDDLPSLEEVRKRYQIIYPTYAIAMLHPVTTELKSQAQHAKVWVKSMLATGDNYVVVFPNNDSGSQYIFDAIETLYGNPKFKIFPSLRFEYFLTLLKNAQYLIGNSSAGIHEAPICGVPTINIGTRQNNRFNHSSIFNMPFDSETILLAHKTIMNTQKFEETSHYGDGRSAEKFMSVLNSDIWLMSNQKTFQDLDISNV
ncbi:MAG: UDP-N-acetylglucosamine 2-epimerase (hydrolyzing) [Paraglaciecola sp.]|jgi:UDP-N-acetylglucosamine 2-epimerase (hydrolysing)